MNPDTLGALAAPIVAEQLIDPNTIANLILALSSLIAAGTGVAGMIQNYFLSKRGANNTRLAEKNSNAISAVATQVTAVDVKVDAVTEQTNGHMTSLIAALAPVDPAAATSAALKIVESAERVAEKLKETATDKAAGKSPPKNILP